MAAQAVDVTLSGHVNRALLITDTDSSTTSSVGDNGSSGTRVRFTGSGEMMEGQSAGVNLEYAAGDDLSLRYAEVWFSGGFGRVSIGQGDQGGEGSVYSDKSGVFGIGHGQENAGVTKRVVEGGKYRERAFTVVAEDGTELTAGREVEYDEEEYNYYTSLDGGSGRNERIRYDTPSVGPFSVAVSVGNGDQVSAGIRLNQDFGGTEFSAALGTIQWPGERSTVSGSAGVKLASGVTISGAWGKGKDHPGMTILPVDAVPAVPNTPAVPAEYRWVDTAATVDHDGDANTADQTWATSRDAQQILIDAGNADDATEQAMVDGQEAEAALRALFDVYECDPEPMADGSVLGDEMTANCIQVLFEPSMPEGEDGSPAVAAIPAMETTTDPSFFQATIGYVFGDTSVGVSWYRASDTVNEGSELTAVGVGVNHNLPKIATNVYAAAQDYSVEDGAYESDDTVIMIGARIRF